MQNNVRRPNKKPIEGEDVIKKKLQYLERLKEKKRLKELLPHLHGHPLYQWQYDFINCRNKLSFLTANNQGGKSSSQIIRAITWATDRSIWPELWPKRDPSQFWYFYPDKDTATREFVEKWEKYYLPKGEYKDSAQYGWRAIYSDGDIYSVEFHSGVTLYFKSYEQKPKNLQAATLDAVFADEEMPEELFSEIIVRVEANDGYYSNVFTATLGQDYLRKTIQPEQHEEENFPQAWKRQISAYQCLRYMDGSPSTVWTREKIEALKAKLPDEDEIDRRIYGKFVLTSGRKYPAFKLKRNVKPYHPIPKDWMYYAGLDYGSGTKKGHKSAIVIVAVDPTLTRARVVKCWRGDDKPTTAGDLLEKYKEMTKDLDITCAYYDHACADLGTISQRDGVPLLKAEKSHDLGESLLNTIFKNGQLIVYETADHESSKLIVELRNLLKDTMKKNAKDDLVDALRYACVKIPFNFVNIPNEDDKPVEPEKPSKPERELTKRERFYRGLDREPRESDDPIMDDYYEAIELLEMYDDVG